MVPDQVGEGTFCQDVIKLLKVSDELEVVSEWRATVVVLGGGFGELEVGARMMCETYSCSFCFK